MELRDTLQIDRISDSIVQLHKMRGDTIVLSMMVSFGPDETHVEFYGDLGLQVTDMGVGPAIIVKDPK